jgi:hypothetical protein
MKVCQHGPNIYIVDQNVLKRPASQLCSLLLKEKKKTKKQMY